MNTNTTVDTLTADTLAKIDTASLPHVMSWFAAMFKKWPTKWAGSMPTEAMCKVAFVLDATRRPGVEALYTAMCFRAEGCTVQQFTTAGNCRAAHNYTRDALCKTGWLVRHEAPMADGTHGKVYSLHFTAKGAARVDKRLAELAAAVTAPEPVKPVKPVKVGKPTKARSKAKGKAKPVEPAQPAPAEMPVSEAPTGSTGTALVPVSEPAQQVDLAALAAHFNG